MEVLSLVRCRSKQEELEEPSGCTVKSWLGVQGSICLLSVPLVVPSSDGSDETNEDESTLGNAVGAKLSDEQAKAQKTSGKDC